MKLFTAEVAGKSFTAEFAKLAEAKKKEYLFSAFSVFSAVKSWFSAFSAVNSIV